jgi:hypothetical protein
MSWLRVTASSTSIVLNQPTLVAHNLFIKNVTKIPHTMLYQQRQFFLVTGRFMKMDFESTFDCWPLELEVDGFFLFFPLL